MLSNINKNESVVKLFFGDPEKFYELTGTHERRKGSWFLSEVRGRFHVYKLPVLMDEVLFRVS